MAKKKTMIYLTEKQQWQLKLAAQEKGESVAALIREAVDQYLARERPQVDYMAIVGMFEGEPGEDASERADEILDEYFASVDIHGESEETRQAVEHCRARLEREEAQAKKKRRAKK